MEIKKEIKYIIKRGKANDSRKVKLGDELVLFSTKTGDAWILDIVDKLAICLLRDKKKQKFKVVETQSQFYFDWEYNYYIKGESFVVVDKIGNKRAILGYPINHLI